MNPLKDKPMQESARDVAVRRFVRELDALQRQGTGRVTLEEIVEAMARTEITAVGVAEVLQSVYYDGIASWMTSPNPANYDRPLIVVYLNREHPVVHAALAGEPLPKKEPRTERLDIRFPIGTIKGEPLSETLIRERR